MAGGITESVVEEIKSRIDLADLIASYGVQVRRAGASWKACCPFHNEKTPSFNIQPSKGFYHCFGCGESGDAITFVQKREGLSFVEAVKKLAAQCGVKIEEKQDPQAGRRRRMLELHAELCEFFRRCLAQTREAETARRYLAGRELDDATIGRFKIGYAPLAPEALLTWGKKHGFSPEELTEAGVLLPPRREGGRWFSRFAGRLMFTITDRQDRAIAFSGRTLSGDARTAKYVNSPETCVFRKSDVLFAYALAAPNILKTSPREAIVCEGQIDVIRCHACGFPTAVASQGTAFTEEHVRQLKKCADSVTLVFDGDGAGRKAAVRTGALFLAAEVPVRVASLPPGEDPDSLLRGRGAEFFRRCLDEAESVTRFQLRTMLEGAERPYSIRLVSEAEKAALETIKACPSAVLRASLAAEAAELLGVPVEAVREDLARAESAPAVRKPRAAAPAEDPPQEEELPEPLDASSPEANPPSACERAFCEFLFAHEADSNLVEDVAKFAPAELFDNVFTRGFVVAWRENTTSDVDAIARFRETISPTMCGWLDGILLSRDKAALSELPPRRILQDFLRRLWVTALKRRQGELPAASSPETDAMRLRYSTAVRRIQRGSWETASPLMDPELLRG